MRIQKDKGLLIMVIILSNYQGKLSLNKIIRIVIRTIMVLASTTTALTIITIVTIKVTTKRKTQIHLIIKFNQRIQINQTSHQH